MKIKKKNNFMPALTEADEKADSDAINVVEYTEEHNIEDAAGTIDINTATPEEIKNNIIASTAETIEKQPEKIKTKFKLYGTTGEDNQLVMSEKQLNYDSLAVYRWKGKIDKLTGTASMSDAEELLYDAYKSSIRDFATYRRYYDACEENEDFDALYNMSFNGFSVGRAGGGYPNLVFFGLPGFGKTGLVESFARQRGVYVVKITAGSGKEVFTGIPYPMPKLDGTIEQGNLSNNKWIEIVKNPDVPVILFFDEVNRADPGEQNAIMDIANNHRIEMTIPQHAVKVKETGKIVTRDSQNKFVYMNNILFSIFAMNPGTQIFKGTYDVDLALWGRILGQAELSGNKKDLEKHIDRTYMSILDPKGTLAPILSEEDYQMYLGQYCIFKHLLNQSDTVWNFDSNAAFNRIQTHDTKWMTQGVDAAKDMGEFKTRAIVHNLSYRTLTGYITESDGTKKSFLKIIKRKNATTTGSLLTKEQIDNLTAAMDDYDFDEEVKKLNLPKSNGGISEYDPDAQSNKVFKAQLEAQAEAEKKLLDLYNSFN